LRKNDVQSTDLLAPSYLSVDADVVLTHGADTRLTLPIAAQGKHSTRKVSVLLGQSGVGRTAQCGSTQRRRTQHQRILKYKSQFKRMSPQVSRDGALAQGIIASLLDQLIQHAKPCTPGNPESRQAMKRRTAFS